jgi:hypothetical protein
VEAWHEWIDDQKHCSPDCGNVASWSVWTGSSGHPMLLGLGGTPEPVTRGFVSRCVFAGWWFVGSFLAPVGLSGSPGHCCFVYGVGSGSGSMGGQMWCLAERMNFKCHSLRDQAVVMDRKQATDIARRWLAEVLCRRLWDTWRFPNGGKPGG